MLLMYLSAYMNITARSPPDEVQSQIILVHFSLGIITPIGQLIRALLVGLNLFSILCIGAPPVKATSYSSLKMYGGPIIYLIGQSLVLFGLLIWHDHGFSINKFRSSQPQHELEDTITHEKEVSDEIARVTNSDDGLRMLHIKKSFSSWATGKIQAVDDLTFGVTRGEVFALVGPNGGIYPIFSTFELMLTSILQLVNPQLSQCFVARSDRTEVMAKCTSRIFPLPMIEILLDPISVSARSTMR
jgi:ATP-binding cassette subfamily A (ABC1) protein 3